jgi:hypothetical protein
MTHDHRAGRQEAARQRRRRRQLLKIGGAIVVVAIVVAAAMIALTGGEKDPPSSTAQQPMTNSTATWEAEAFTGGPRLAVDQVAHDQGPVAYGEPVHAAFQLRNVGDQPLTLGEMTVNTLEGC